MFVRQKKVSGSDAIRVQIVHNRRIGTKVRQKVLRHVGTAYDGAALAELVQTAELLKEKMRQAESTQFDLFTPLEYVSLDAQQQRPRETAHLGVDLGRLRETKRLAIGMRQVFGELYREFDWSQVLGARRMSSNRIIRELVLARIWQPRSKRATVSQLEHEAGVSLNLERVYQSMDYLDVGCIDKKIRQVSFEKAESLLGQPLKVLFYDLSTLYFESECEDRLRRKGYSKDGKSNRVQVVLALMLTEHGLPVDYQVFAGNTYEGHTLAAALERLQSRYSPNRLTVVADSALLSRSNQSLLQARGLSYILGYRLRSGSKALQKKVLDRSAYRPWSDSSEAAGLDIARYQVIEQDGHRIVVTYSEKRARKDQRMRDKALEKLQRRLDKRGTVRSIVSGQHSRYLQFSSTGSVCIDPHKVAEQARWDGLRALIAYGNDEMSPAQLVAQYRQLWQIEHGFRTNKHDLRMRPIYHWTERRVQAHIAICYMAYCCVAHLRYRLKTLGYPMSLQHIRTELSRLQLSIYRCLDSDREYAAPSPASVDCRRIYRAVGLNWHEQPFQVQNPDQS